MENLFFKTKTMFTVIFTMTGSYHKNVLKRYNLFYNRIVSFSYCSPTFRVVYAFKVMIQNDIIHNTL